MLRVSCYQVGGYIPSKAGSTDNSATPSMNTRVHKTHDLPNRAMTTEDKNDKFPGCVVPGATSPADLLDINVLAFCSDGGWAGEESSR